jgi:protein tyrosine phosphatase (PTP) superfamily phosphohydrolase (DUF442 family)
VTKKIAFVIVLAGLSAALAHVGFRVSMDGIRLARNFYEVDPGKLYRSAQLTGQELAGVIDRYKIKSIINLQGKRPETDWYTDEARVARTKGVTLINLEMTVESIPKRFELLKLLEAYRTLERPILVHCRSGSDRTGEAVAIYKMEYMDQSRERALQSFNLRYLYVPFFAPAKTYFIENYGGRDWAYTRYDHCDKNWEYADQRECPSQ